VAALFDTTAAVLLLRRRPPEECIGLIEAAHAEITAGTALLPAVGVAELMVGEREPRRARALASALSLIPAVILPPEAAADAGSMGAFLGEEGASVPFPDLLIAATAVWLEVPLLTWDSDFSRSRGLALASRSRHRGADAWRRLLLHPASRGSAAILADDSMES
jgi:predicted nucleic acid-binding protein